MSRGSVKGNRVCHETVSLILFQNDCKIKNNFVIKDNKGGKRKRSGIMSNTMNGLEQFCMVESDSPEQSE